MSPRSLAQRPYRRSRARLFTLIHGAARPSVERPTKDSSPISSAHTGSLLLELGCACHACDNRSQNQLVVAARWRLLGESGLRTGRLFRLLFSQSEAEAYRPPDHGPSWASQVLRARFLHLARFPLHPKGQLRRDL